MLEKTPLKTLVPSLFLFSLLIHCLGAWNLPLMDRDEPRFAEASREMRQSGDFLIPRFNGQDRYDKPPLIYWCQTASYALFGENEFSARFPSGLAAALTALLIFGFALRLYDRKTGFWAAVLFTTCAQTLLLAKAAVTDTLLTFFYTAVLWAAWELLSQKKFRWHALFCGGLALGFLAKGPVVFLPVLALFIFATVTKTRFNKLACFAGVLVSLLMIGLWAVPAFMKTNGAYFEIGIGRHVIERSLKPLENHGAQNLLWYAATLPFYLVTFFISFLPWSWRAPQMIRLLRNKMPDLKTMYLLCQILVVFALFSGLRTKLPHYTFPAFPALTILWAHLWVKEGLPGRPLALGASFMVILSLVVSFIVFPHISDSFVSKNLVQKCAPALTADMKLASVNYNEPSLVWYFRKYLKPWHQALNEAEILPFMRREGPRACVVPTELAGRLWDPLPAGWRRVQAQGWNIAKGKPVDITALIKPD